MLRLLIATSALALLSACDGDGTQPFDFDQTDGDVAGDGSGGGTGGDGNGGSSGGDGDGAGEQTVDQEGVAVETQSAERPPGTSEPDRLSRIIRYEPQDEFGGRIINPVIYDGETDTVLINNLPFDGENIYTRDSNLPTLGGYAVFEAPEMVLDFLDADVIEQVSPYRAIVGVSTNSVTRDGQELPRTSFAIVRTGGYVEYGFGGFVYSREGGFVIPQGGTEIDGIYAGQARFEGEYAGMRVFQNRGGLEFTRGDMRLDIDFDDFDDGDAVKGMVFNRQAFDLEGNLIPTNSADTDLQLPIIRIDVQPGFNASGELFGQDGSVQSTIVDADGNLEEYETGRIYAILAGDTTARSDGGEVVGVLVVESTDPRFDVPVQETGGFILYR